MNKDEILAKSRKENEVSDERSNRIKMQGANFSISILIILWIAITRLVPLDAIGKLSLGLLTQATSFSNFAYQVLKNKSITSIVFTIAFAITSSFYLYQILSITNVLPF